VGLRKEATEFRYKEGKLLSWVLRASRSVLYRQLSDSDNTLVKCIRGDYPSVQVEARWDNLDLGFDKRLDLVESGGSCDLNGATLSRFKFMNMRTLLLEYSKCSLLRLLTLTSNLEKLTLHDLKNFSGYDFKALKFERLEVLAIDYYDLKAALVGK
jgi:hypothetical protein